MKDLRRVAAVLLVGLFLGLPALAAQEPILHVEVQSGYDEDEEARQCCRAAAVSEISHKANACIRACRLPSHGECQRGQRQA